MTSSASRKRAIIAHNGGTPGRSSPTKNKKVTRFLFNKRPQNLARAIQSNFCRGRRPRSPANKRIPQTKTGDHWSPVFLSSYFEIASTIRANVERGGIARHNLLFLVVQNNNVKFVTLRGEVKIGPFAHVSAVYGEIQCVDRGSTVTLCLACHLS